MRRRLGPLAILVGTMLAGMAMPARADTIHKATCSESICWVGNKDNSYTPAGTAQVDVFSYNEALNAAFVAIVYQIDENGGWTIVAKNIGLPEPIAQGDFMAGFQIGYGRRASWSETGTTTTATCRDLVWLVWVANSDGTLALAPQSSNFC